VSVGGEKSRDREGKRAVVAILKDKGKRIRDRIEAKRIEANGNNYLARAYVCKPDSVLLTNETSTFPEFRKLIMVSDSARSVL
jgi:hypothetical protein